MTAGLSNVQPKNAELVGKAKRDLSTYVSKGIDPVSGNSGRDGLENDIVCNFDALFESATLRLKEESRYRTFIDLEKIAAEAPTGIWHSKGGPREVRYCTVLRARIYFYYRASTTSMRCCCGCDSPFEIIRSRTQTPARKCGAPETIDRRCRPSSHADRQPHRASYGRRLRAMPKGKHPLS